MPPRPINYSQRAKPPASMPLAARLKRLEVLLGYLTPITAESVKSEARAASGKASLLDPIACDRFELVLEAWRKAFQWTDGLETALAVMFACAASTTTIGDQLWVKIIGPASCGKTSLCEAFSLVLKYVKSVSTFRGFHSGYGDGTEDHSLLSKLPNMTLLTKDGDTLLQSPNLSQILSEGRDAYDTSSRTSYRNRASKDYLGIRFSWILCGTASLRTIDKSELGQRFLDCVVMHGIDDDLEDRILLQVANRVKRTLSSEPDMKQYDPDLQLAMQLTAGYLIWLRQNIHIKLADLEMSDAATFSCTRYAKYVSYMRARPSENQNDERELAARLTSQHTKLAMCLAVVMNKASVDDEVLKRVKKVALDTARGHSSEIAELLWKAPEGMEIRAISLYTNYPDDKTRTMLRFLKQLGAVTMVAEGSTGKLGGVKTKWMLSHNVRKLMTNVIGIDELSKEQVALN
jgi:predicted transcriptional regulator